MPTLLYSKKKKHKPRCVAKTNEEYKESIQLGIYNSVASHGSGEGLLMTDFNQVHQVYYPRKGSHLTPAHKYKNFYFKTIAPNAFQRFRQLFGINPDSFKHAVCVCPLREIANPGASGSAFYFSHNNEFIIKTVSIKEAKFLVQLLPQYFMNIQENKQTLLPKFYGLYQYKSGCKTITFVIMNNWLPSSLSLQEKYDIKGSTYGRKASAKERQKSSPTFKDLDLLEHHTKGFLLDKEIYKALMQTLTRDCRVLESFKIMDYSLLIGVYKTDGSFGSFHGDLTDGTDGWEDVDECVINESTNAVFLTQNRTISSLTAEGSSSINPLASRNRISLFSTPLEAIALDCNLDFTDGQEEPQDIPPGGIPALNADGEQVFIFLGIIDILQSYGVKKRLEYFFKSLYSNRNTISVNPPDKYKSRFLTFQTKVFTYDQQGNAADTRDIEANNFLHQRDDCIQFLEDVVFVTEDDFADTPEKLCSDEATLNLQDLDQQNVYRSLPDELFYRGIYLQILLN